MERCMVNMKEMTHLASKRTKQSTCKLTGMSFVNTVDKTKEPAWGIVNLKNTNGVEI